MPRVLHKGQNQGTGRCAAVAIFFAHAELLPNRELSSRSNVPCGRFVFAAPALPTEPKSRNENQSHNTKVNAKASAEKCPAALGKRASISEAPPRMQKQCCGVATREPYGEVFLRRLTYISITNSRHWHLNRSQARLHSASPSPTPCARLISVAVNLRNSLCFSSSQPRNCTTDDSTFCRHAAI